MSIYSIYKITNQINGKSYIGFDSNWPDRKTKHIWNANRKYYPTKILYKAFHKYKISNFTFELIFQSKEYHYTKNIMEEYFIKLFNSHYIDGNGYNMTYGGEGEKGNKSRTNMPHKEQAKLKISLKNRGKSAWNRTPYILENIKGDKYYIESSNEVEKFGLNVSSMKSALARNTFIKGWKLSKVS